MEMMQRVPTPPLVYEFYTRLNEINTRFVVMFSILLAS